MTSGLLDIRTPWPESIHPARCACLSCRRGEYSVPFDLASSEDLGRFILGRTKNETGVSDLELRGWAFKRVLESRQNAPQTPGEPCSLWDSEGGHHGHHWYLLGNDHYKCDCGKLR